MPHSAWPKYAVSEDKNRRETKLLLLPRLLLGGGGSEICYILKGFPFNGQEKLSSLTGKNINADDSRYPYISDLGISININIKTLLKKTIIYRVHRLFYTVYMDVVSCLSLLRVIRVFFSDNVGYINITGN